MEKSTYKRKTTNPKSGWTEERRAKHSAMMRKAHAEGTWHKQSKKAIGLAISNGRKEAAKFKNRSNGQKKAWRKRQKEENFFSSENVSKRLNKRKTKEQEAIMNHPPTTLSENLLDKAVLPAEEEVTIEVKEELHFEEENKPAQFPQPFETWTKDQNNEFARMISVADGMLNQAEKALGVRPSLHHFLMAAIDSKLQYIVESMQESACSQYTNHGFRPEEVE